MPKADTTPNTTRRALALRGGAFAAIGITAGAAASVADLAINPDAELIAFCRQHVINLTGYNADGHLAAADDPLWRAYLGTKDAISAAQPQTMAGLVAKAQAAKAEALEPDGSENWHGPAADWAGDLVNDLLRLGGRA